MTDSTVNEQNLPPLLRDRSYHGMLSTQFLGAFNDNLFKQLVLLMCVELKNQSGTDYQSYALALFALPFVLFSGLAGFLSDRFSKRTIVILAKVAEIGVMAAGLTALLVDWGGDESQIIALFCVLFVMSMQSTFFGPAKYGILPELFRKKDLPAANGLIQMTTFLAIIFGMAAAGFARQALGNDSWLITVFCVVIAVIGTCTATLIRQTPVAHPGLAFQWESLGINAETWKLLKSDRALILVLLISSLFWFIGGIVQPAVNDFGKLEMHLGDGRTSLMATCMGFGIAIGCVLAGRLSRRNLDFRLVTVGAWGLAGHLIFLGWVGYQFGFPEPLVEDPDASWMNWLVPASTGEFLARLGLLGMGIMAGLFSVPLQVFLQSRPPRDQKGRMIGAMNLINWLGIIASAGAFKLMNLLQNAAGRTAEDIPRLPISAVFPLLGILMIPVALCFRRWLKKAGVEDQPE